MSSDYYVYVAKVEDEIIYVGSGKDNRYKHVTSGNSHNQGLNFLVRQGVDIEVDIVFSDLSKEGSRAEEQKLIDLHRPAFNKATAASKKTQEDHAELQQIHQRNREIAPTAYEMTVARQLYHIYKMEDLPEVGVLSFAASLVGSDGISVFTLKELEAFMSKHMSDCQHFVPSWLTPSTICGERVYKVSFVEIETYLLNYDDEHVYRARAAIVKANKFVESRERMLTHKHQLDLF